MSYSGDVFRAPYRDRHGDPVDIDGNPVDILDKDGLAFIGTLTDIYMGAVTAGSPTVLSESTLGSPSRQESSDSTVTLGCPRHVEPKLRYGDRIVIDGVKFEIKSNPKWDSEHPWTGTDFGRYWVDALGRVGN